MVIHDCIAVTDGSPFRLCGDITHKFSVLKGLKIDRGWTKHINGVLAGAEGCTHQWELLGRVATVAYQSTNNARKRVRQHKVGDIPRVFNTCHMYTPESFQTLKRWPELYKGSKESV
jgi:hypothetical protein